MIDYINSHQSGFWFAVGFLLLAAEVLLFGFTTIIFLFGGLAALLTGTLMVLGVLPKTWIAGLACTGISSGVISALLWKPLKKLQDQSTPVKGQTSDFIGIEFVLQQTITPTQTGTHRYSGVDWTVELATEAVTESLPTGTRVQVTSVDAGIFRVDATDSKR